MRTVKVRRRSALGRLWALLAVLASPNASPARPSRTYAVSGRCAGFPKVALKTRAGTCVGFVGSKLGFPRGLAELRGSIYITDLGSRLPGRGRLLRVRLDRPWNPTIVLSHLDRPGAIVSGPDGLLYVAESNRIFRFNPEAADPAASVEAVLTGLPTDGLHNLPGLAIDRGRGLFVSVGSASDNCEDAVEGRPDPNRPCFESALRPPRGSILRLTMNWRRGSRRAIEVYATGIRNALAMVQLPSGALLAASNGRDNIDAADPRLSDQDLPHDLLLKVNAGSRHAWPYCFDLDRPSPEYPRANCATFTKPLLLLPPHAAPLSMLLTHGKLGPARDARLVMAFHGYRSAGHRIVGFATDSNGMPKGSPVNLVWGWNAVPQVRPQGAPVALLELSDGSILILEDHNSSLLRLAAERLTSARRRRPWSGPGASADQFTGLSSAAGTARG